MQKACNLRQKIFQPNILVQILHVQGNRFPPTDLTAVIHTMIFNNHVRQLGSRKNVRQVKTPAPPATPPKAKTPPTPPPWEAPQPAFPDGGLHSLTVSLAIEDANTILVDKMVMLKEVLMVVDSLLTDFGVKVQEKNLKKSDSNLKTKLAFGPIFQQHLAKPKQIIRQS